MALYVPAGRRRRRAALLAGAALVVGLGLGLIAGRATAPDVGERVHATQREASVVTAELRVLSLHQEAGAASQTTGGDNGAAFAIRRAKTDLTAALDDAPWITSATRQQLLASLDDLLAEAGDAEGPAFAEAVDNAAGDIDAAFGMASSTTGR